MKLMKLKLRSHWYIDHPLSDCSAFVHGVVSLRGQDRRALTENNVKNALFEYCHHISSTWPYHARILRNEAENSANGTTLAAALETYGIAQKEGQHYRSIAPHHFRADNSSYLSFVRMLKDVNDGVFLTRADYDDELAKVEEDTMDREISFKKRSRNKEAFDRLRKESEKYWASRSTQSGQSEPH